MKKKKKFNLISTSNYNFNNVINQKMKFLQQLKSKIKKFSIYTTKDDQQKILIMLQATHQSNQSKKIVLFSSLVP